MYRTLDGFLYYGQRRAENNCTEGLKKYKHEGAMADILNHGMFTFTILNLGLGFLPWLGYSVGVLLYPKMGLDYGIVISENLTILQRTLSIGQFLLAISKFIDSGVNKIYSISSVLMPLWMKTSFTMPMLMDLTS